MGDKNSQIIAAVVVIVLILGAVWFVSQSKYSPVIGSVPEESTNNTDEALDDSAGISSTGSDDTDSTAAPTTSPAGEAIAVADQPAGSSVALGAITISRPTWIAVKDQNGWILGAARFDANLESGTIPLLRAMTAGETYTLIMYADDGDKLFDFHIDMLVAGEGTIVPTFKVQ